MIQPDTRIYGGENIAYGAEKTPEDGGVITPGAHYLSSCISPGLITSRNLFEDAGTGVRDVPSIAVTHVVPHVVQDDLELGITPSPGGANHAEGLLESRRAHVPRDARPHLRHVG